MSKKISVIRFLEENSGRPALEDEIAYAARFVDNELGDLAKDFIDVRENFLASLEENGFEWG